MIFLRTAWPDIGIYGVTGQEAKYLDSGDTDRDSEFGINEEHRAMWGGGWKNLSGYVGVLSNYHIEPTDQEACDYLAECFKKHGT